MNLFDCSKVATLVRCIIMIVLNVYCLAATVRYRLMCYQPAQLGGRANRRVANVATSSEEAV